MTPVLVVDDSRAVGTMLVRVLEHAGFDVRWAATGAEALALAVEHSPVVVLLDVDLPDTDGLALARELRACAATAGARLVGLSGRPVAADEQGDLDAFVLKPVRMPDLLAVMHGD